MRVACLIGGRFESYTSSYPVEYGSSSRTLFTRWGEYRVLSFALDFGQRNLWREVCRLFGFPRKEPHLAVRVIFVEGRPLVSSMARVDVIATGRGSKFADSSTIDQQNMSHSRFRPRLQPVSALLYPDFTPVACGICCTLTWVVPNHPGSKRLWSGR